MIGHENSLRALPRYPKGWRVWTWMDNSLLILLTLLLLVGLVTLGSASLRLGLIESGSGLSYVLKQAVFVLVGCGVTYLIASRTLKQVRRFTWVFAGLTLVLLFLTLAMGKTANGAERWLAIGQVQVQTSEFAKIAVVMLLADAFALPQHHQGRNKAIGSALVASCLMMALVFQQPNLSVTLILAGTLCSMAWLSGLSVLWFATILPLGGMLVWHKIVSTPYQYARILGWLEAAQHPAKEGYNLIQSLKAICHGGFWGQGLGGSIHKLGFLPFQHTDFIFSVFCEEFGWVGAVGIILGLCATFFRGGMIAWHTQNLYGKFLAAGIVVVMFLQTWVNLAVTTGTMPVTGVTLPLVSYGGTSVLVTMAMFGLLFLVARQPIEMPRPRDSSRQVTRIHPEFVGMS
jgi:cell division protein FtsW